MVRSVYTKIEDFISQNDALHVNLPYQADTAVLKTAYKLLERTVANRLVCQAMEGCDGTPDGKPGELTARRYRRFAKGGAGMIWFEATAVMQEGRANPRQLYITPENVDAFRKIVSDIKETALKENGIEPIVIMQATHSGRYSNPQGEPAPFIAYIL